MAKPNYRDTDKLLINSQYFQGGITVDYKMGIANSYYSSMNMDNRTFPSQLSVLPGSQQIAGNLHDLITSMDQDLNGVRWASGDQGWLYQISTSNVVSPIVQMSENGSAGLIYSQITDQLYIPGQESVSMYGRVTQGATGEPVFRDGVIGVSASVAYGCVALYDTADGLFDGSVRNNAQSVGVTQGITLTNYTTLITNTLTNTYTLPSTIIENATNYCFFAPDIEPFYSVAVYVDNVGTGDWTLTLHDSLNNELGSNTITNADMVTGWNNFVFGKQVRAFVNAANVGTSPLYHFHLTSSVSGDTATVYTVNSNDVSSCNFLLFAYRLVDIPNGWHPTTYFTGTGVPLLCTGNERYLSTYNFGNDANPSNSQWQRSALTFKPGDEVCGLTVNQNYLVIACRRRSDEPSKQNQRGILYFWDGSTAQPSMKIDLPMGAPYGIYTFNNITYFACAGSLYAWSSGQTVLKVRKLAYQNTDFMGAPDQTLVYPQGFTSRYDILLMGYPGYTTDPQVSYGVWSWGGVELTYPNSYAYSYSPSIGITRYTTTNDLHLGLCQNFVDDLFTSWEYTDSSSVTHYGLDLVNNSSPPAKKFNYYSLIYDGGVVYRAKMAVRYKVYFEPLPAGCTLTPAFSVDRNPVTYGATVGEGAIEALVELNNLRFHELQYGFIGTCDTTELVRPVILGVTLEVDPTQQEGDILHDGIIPGSTILGGGGGVDT